MSVTGYFFTIQIAGEFPHYIPSVTAYAPPVFCPFQLRSSNMAESCDLRGLRHCLTFGLGLARISLPWDASFVGPATKSLLRSPLCYFSLTL